MKHTRHRTKLGDWMRLATEEERAALAKHADTSLNYLYQLAGVHRENPNVRLALALVDGANALRKGRMLSCDKSNLAPLPVLDIRDLAAPTRH